MLASLPACQRETTRACLACQVGKACDELCREHLERFFRKVGEQVSVDRLSFFGKSFLYSGIIWVLLIGTGLEEEKEFELHQVLPRFYHSVLER